MVKAMKAEHKVMTLFAEVYPKYRAELWASKKLTSDRIIRNHSMLLALLDCLQLVLTVPEPMMRQTRQYIRGMASDRQAAITTDPQELNDFWQVFDYLESLPGSPLVNHSKNPGVIAINLNQFAEVAHEHRQRIPDLATLRRMLKDGRTHRMIDASKPTESIIRANLQARTPMSPIPQSVRCWHFKT